jgi:DNA-binding NarL/FixJ family response regulator
MRDDPAEVARLGEMAVASALSPPARIEALWIKLASAIEHDSLAAEATFQRLQDAKEPGPTHAARLRIAKGLMLCQAGRVHDALRNVDLATELMSKAGDPFARTNLLHHLAYTLMLSARYDDSLTAADAAIAEGRDAGLEFVIDHGLIRRAGALIGMRRLGQARATIDELERRSASASGYVLSHIVLERVKLAIAVGDPGLAQALLETLTGSSRPAFSADICGYEAVLLAASGDATGATTKLQSRADCSKYVEAAALGDVARAIIALRSRPKSDGVLALLQGLFDRGEVDAVVTGYRVCPDLVRETIGTRLEQRTKELLTRSRDFDIAKNVGLKLPRELRPRGRLSPREQEVYELLIHGRANHEIAKTLFISTSTTKVHVRHIFEKLGVHSRAEAARMASFNGEAASREPEQPRDR